MATLIYPSKAAAEVDGFAAGEVEEVLICRCRDCGKEEEGIWQIRKTWNGHTAGQRLVEWVRKPKKGYRPVSARPRKLRKTATFPSSPSLAFRTALSASREDTPADPATRAPAVATEVAPGEPNGLSGGVIEGDFEGDDGRPRRDDEDDEEDGDVDREEEDEELEGREEGEEGEAEGDGRRFSAEDEDEGEGDELGRSAVEEAIEHNAPGGANNPNAATHGAHTATTVNNAHDRPPDDLPHPPNRQLPPHLTEHVIMFLTFVERGMGRSSWEALRYGAAAGGRESLSWFQVNRMVERLVRLKEETVEICAKCGISFSLEAYKDLDRCPFDQQPRWRPLTAQEKAKKRPPKHGTPYKTVPYWPIEQYVHAINASPSAIEETRAWHEESTRLLSIPENRRPTMSKGLADSPYILRLRQEGLLHNQYSTAFIYSSDGAVLKSEKGKEAISGEFHIARRASSSLKTQFEHRSFWRCKTVGPRKSSHADSNNFEFEREMERLEKGIWVWNVREGKKIRTNAVTILDSSDTVAANSKCKGRGSHGKQACYYCTLEGELVDGHYVPCVMRPYGSQASDVWLPGMEELNGRGEAEGRGEGTAENEDLRGEEGDEGGQQPVPLEQRDWDLTAKVLRDLFEEKGGLNTDAGQKHATDNGIGGYPIFSQTDAHAVAYPFYWSLGQMHWLYNIINHVLDLLDRSILSKAQPAPLTPAARVAMSKLHDHARHLSPSALGQAISALKHRHSYKLTEVIRLCDELPHLVANVGLEEKWKDYIYLFVKVLRGISAACVDRGENGSDPDSYDCTALRDDGLDVVPLAALKLLIPRFVVQTEALFYGRDREYLLKVLKITIHRTLHWPDLLNFLGPSYSYAEYGMEGVIGDDKRHMSTNRHPIGAIINHQRRVNVAILLRLYFDLPPPLTLSKPRRKATHHQIPDMALLHPSANAALTAEEEDLLSAWAVREGVERVGGLKPRRWARCDLGLKNEVLRSSWGEKTASLAEEDEGLGRGEYCGGGEEVRSAKFAKVTTPELGTRIVEVESYLAVPISGEREHRLLAVVTHYPTSVEAGVAESFCVADGERAVIGLEALRCTVGGVPRGVEPDGSRRLGVMMRAGRNRRPYTVVDQWK